MKFSLFSICALLIISACSPEVKTDYDIYEVQGNVKKIRFFNKDGVQNADASFTKNGKLIYDRQGAEMIEYEYDKNSIITGIQMFTDNTLTSKRRYFYDDEKLVEIKQFSADGSFVKSLQYEYDSSGNISRGELKTPYNKLEYVWEYEYDKNNNKRMERHESFTMTFKKRLKYTVNENGNVELIREFDDYDELFRERYFTIYNSVSLETKRYNYWVGEVSDSMLFSYEFDVRGNWIRKEIKPYPGRPITVSREIDYYE